MGSHLCEWWCTVGPTSRTNLDPPKMTASPRGHNSPIHIGSQRPVAHVGFPRHAPTELTSTFLQTKFRSRRNFARNNKPGLRNLNDVAALVYRPAEENYRA